MDKIAQKDEDYRPSERITYKMIQEYIKSKYDFKVHTAYIAEVKRGLGLPMHDAPNAVEEMKKLFVKDSKRTFIKATMLCGRKVALIFTIVLGLLFGTLLFNTEVQATVGKVLIEWYENFTSFTFREDTTINEKKDWILNYLVKGYIEKNHEVLGDITNIEFVNSQDNKIRFSYRSEGGTANISVDNENHEIDSCIILDNEAFSIRAVNDEFDNGVIWNMDDHTFDLWGKVSTDELYTVLKIKTIYR